MIRPIVVTGASGFIGRHLVRTLATRKRKILALVRARAAFDQGLNSSVEQIVVSDWSGAGLVRALSGRDFGVIFNLAAYGVNPDDRKPDLMQRANVDLPCWLVALAQSRRAAVVSTGSSAEYAGDGQRVPLSESAPLEVVKLYGASKARGGGLAQAAAHQANVPFRHLRLFNIFGIGETTHRLLPSLVRATQKGERVSLSEGSQIRDFVMIEDAVAAILRAGEALEKEQAGGASILNVCSGQGVSVREFVSAAARQLEIEPDLLGFGDLAMRNDEIEWLVGDPRRIAIDLSWKPFYQLEDGIAAALSAFRCE